MNFNSYPMNIRRHTFSRALLQVSLIFGFIGLQIDAESQQVTMRTMALSSGEMPELYLATPGNKDEPLTPIDWATSQPSRFTVVSSQEGFLPLYHLAVSEDGKETPQVAHRIKLPGAAKEILLFGWMNQDKLQFHVIEDKFLDAKFNDWLLVNMSSKEIAFQVGSKTKPIVLKTTESKLHTIAVREGEGANVRGLANIQGEARPFYSTYLPVQKSRRTIVLFSDHGEKIRTKLITDHFSLKN